MKVIRNVFIGISLVFLMALIASACVTDPSDVTATDDQEVTTQPLTSSADEACPPTPDVGELEAGAALTDIGGAETHNALDFARCMAVQLATTITPQCVDTCINCLIGNIFTRPAYCTLCGVCAGKTGVQAAKFCKRFLLPL